MPQRNWSSPYWGPFRPICYFYKRGTGNGLYCYIIAKDITYKEFVILSWQYNKKNMRKGLRELELYKYKQTTEETIPNNRRINRNRQEHTCKISSKRTKLQPIPRANRR